MIEIGRQKVEGRSQTLPNGVLLPSEAGTSLKKHSIPGRFQIVF